MKKVFMFLSIVIGSICGFFVGRNTKKGTEEDERVYKFKSYYNMLNQWLFLKQSGKSIETYFQKNDIKSIAIYGMGEMGNRLYDELKERNIEIKYGIDKNIGKAYSEIKMYDCDEEWEEVDAIVITAIFAFDEISEKISSKTSIPIVSLEDVVYEA